MVETVVYIDPVQAYLGGEFGLAVVTAGHDDVGVAIGHERLGSGEAQARARAGDDDHTLGLGGLAVVRGGGHGGRLDGGCADRCVSAGRSRQRTGFAGDLGGASSHSDITGACHVLAADGRGGAAEGTGLGGRGAAQEGCSSRSKGGGKRHGGACCHARLIDGVDVVQLCHERRHEQDRGVSRQARFCMPAWSSTAQTATREAAHAGHGVGDNTAASLQAMHHLRNHHPTQTRHAQRHH